MIEKENRNMAIYLGGKKICGGQGGGGGDDQGRRCDDSRGDCRAGSCRHERPHPLLQRNPRPRNGGSPLRRDRTYQSRRRRPFGLPPPRPLRHAAGPHPDHAPRRRRQLELVAERQRNEEMRQQQAAKQQALMARLASLESPSIGTTDTLATNQSREAKMVKIPGWMHIGAGKK